ncbi:MAG: UDP:flavonoid glycosyltransferase YjiC (YdhE family) [Parasphingorhabdus sp.]|jgi:UDP:flavonoid glycosyltransferase YjiC (YdhE family)
MKHIMLCWELGGGTGHLRKLLVLGQGLAVRGYRITLATRNVTTAEKLCHRLATEENFVVNYIQSPHWHTQPGFTGLPQGFPEILAELGFYDVDCVAGLIRAWDNLFKQYKVDCVIGDYSPGSIMASHVVGIPAARVGTGFTCPPLTTPFPAVLLRKNSGREALSKIEQRVLDTTNRALQRFSHQPFRTLAETQATKREYLATFNEMDHFGERKDADYYGVYDLGQSEVEPVWPTMDAPKIFVYYHASYSKFAAVVESLANSNYAVLLVAPGIGPDQARQLVRKNINICSRAVNLADVAQEADLCITHGGHGAVAGLLLNGCKMLLCPMFNEQKILAIRLRQQNLAGLCEAPEQLTDQIPSALADETMARKSRAFARRYRHWTGERQLGIILDDIERNLI